ncbi:hypothetical protein ACFQLX_22330 [Streptomyces polyrhachis]|uniref:Pycsar effector protein domain-containing protein n=1 Tax=Streptomyces polyrhachis TaxID=1282885 RepID=A0ABW2GJG4_9ACTN
MFVEVQRADTKAAALFGVAGGLLAAVVACALSDSARRMGWTLLVPLGALSLPLLAAVVVALTALRPALGWRCDFPLRGEGCFDGSTIHSQWLESLGERRQLLAEVERLAMLRALARRKYRLVRLSVDLIMTAHGVAGSTLLIVPFTL